MMERHEEIRQRYAANDPLNLSAVQREAPHLLEGLWEPDHFIGWRRTVEAAGIPIENIRVFPGIEVTCPLCGWTATRLVGHLGLVHGLTIAEIRKTHPEAEEVCEELRAAKRGVKKNRKALSLGPHWEPAWSKWYALDRLRWFYDHGIPVNYASIAAGEPGMAAYLRRVMGSWGQALSAIGLKPASIRLNAETRTWTPKQLINTLRRIARKNPARLSLEFARNGSDVTFFRAVIRTFHSYEAALTAAQLDPLTIIPALADPLKTARRDQLLLAAAARIKSRPRYHPAEVAAFMQEWQPTINEFYGSWVSLADVLNADERDIFNPPAFTNYTQPDLVIAALQERPQHGLSIRENEIRIDNSPLYLQGKKLFHTWNAALAAAGLQRPPRSLHLRKYTPETFLEALKERHRQGKTMNSFKISEERTDALLMKWARRFFGSWHQALAAAGIPPVERSKPVRKIPPAPVPSEKYLDQIRARHAAGLPLHQSAMLPKISEGGHPGLLGICRKRFGSWKNALLAAGVPLPEKPTKPLPYPTPEAVLTALRQRHQAGIPLNYTNFQKGPGANKALYLAILQCFPSVSAALQAANLPAPPRFGPDQRLFKTKDEVRSELQRRHADGEPLVSTFILKTPSGTGLYNAALKHFGGWTHALADAGFPPNPSPGRPPSPTSKRALAAAAALASGKPRRRQQGPYRTPEDILTELRHRHHTGLPNTPTPMRQGPDANSALLKAIKRHFPDFRTALQTAGLPIPLSLTYGPTKREYTQESIIQNIQERHARGEHLGTRDVMSTPHGQSLVKAASKLFGGWTQALAATGLPPNPIPGRRRIP